MSFAEKSAQKQVDTGQRSNPELEAKLNGFVKDNPRLHERLSGMSKDELVRRLMSERVGRPETLVRRNRELAQWVEENPEIVAKVEHRLKIAGNGNRRSEAIDIGRTEAIKREMRGPRLAL